MDSCPLPIWNPVSSATLCSLKLPHVLGGKKAPEAASVSKALPWRRRNSNLMLEVHGVLAAEDPRVVQVPHARGYVSPDGPLEVPCPDRSCRSLKSWEPAEPSLPLLPPAGWPFRESLRPGCPEPLAAGPACPQTGMQRLHSELSPLDPNSRPELPPPQETEGPPESTAGEATAQRNSRSPTFPWGLIVPWEERSYL